MVSRSEPPGPILVVGRYALYGEIAAGGMATVHLGRLLGPVGFSRTVALKRLHPQFAKDPEFVAMFLDEARLAARIRHPNVVPTLDVVAENGELFLVMDYVQGESLSRLLRLSRADDRLPIAPNIVASIVAGALHGLHAAHEARDERGEPLNIVHRDVSPQNILVGVDGVARVLDFGIAKAAGRIQVTREGRLKGKLAYMPPEHLLSGTVTRKADIYAAAVVLWEALTRRRLFEADNEFALVDKVRNLAVEPPSRYVPGLPKAFDEVTLRGMARDPKDRFETAREMATALEQCGGVALATEVGDWVVRTAEEALTRRAAQIASIESGGGKPLDGRAPDAESPVDPRGSAPPGVRLVHDPEDEALTVERREHLSAHPPALGGAQRPIEDKTSVPPTIEPERAGGMPRTPFRRPRALVLASIAVMCAIAILSFSALRTRGEPTSAPAAAAAGSEAPSPSSSPSGETTTEIPLVAMPPTTTVATSPPSPPPSSAKSAPARSLRRSGQPSREPSVNCDPPYVVDSQGIQRLKRECLPR